PEGAALTFAWQQTAGPSVMLSDPASATPQFTAPLVNADTTLTFQVAVSDGVQMATDTVDVLVKDIPTTTGSGGAGASGAGGAGAEGGGGAGGSGTGTGGGFTLDQGNCGCRLPGDAPRGGAAAISALGLLAWMMRRRRRSMKG